MNDSLTVALTEILQAIGFAEIIIVNNAGHRHVDATFGSSRYCGLSLSRTTESEAPNFLAQVNPGCTSDGEIGSVMKIALPVTYTHVIHIKQRLV